LAFVGFVFLVLAGLRAVLGSEGLFLTGLPILIGGACALGALLSWFGARRILTTARSLPLLKRPALVADRRSETGVGGPANKTCYFFQLEFEDGTEGEFMYPGRGASHDPMVSGNTGIAYTRRDRLLAFKQIKV
jgi:hypothetical protein